MSFTKNLIYKLDHPLTTFYIYSSSIFGIYMGASLTTTIPFVDKSMTAIYPYKLYKNKKS